MSKKPSPCGGCGGEVLGLNDTIVKSCSYLAQGHRGVSEMYRLLAAQVTNESDRQLMLSAADKHSRMALDTANGIVVLEQGGPDDQQQEQQEGGEASANPER